MNITLYKIIIPIVTKTISVKLIVIFLEINCCFKTQIIKGKYKNKIISAIIISVVITLEYSFILVIKKDNIQAIKITIIIKNKIEVIQFNKHEIIRSDNLVFPNNVEKIEVPISIVINNIFSKKSSQTLTLAGSITNSTMDLLNTFRQYLMNVKNTGNTAIIENNLITSSNKTVIRTLLK
ncbi:hypothetical protein DMN77_13965 [Paenibacillus sp. 79R4]|nr:hypothetical protein [Paenibacillus sp. 79R4]